MLDAAISDAPIVPTFTAPGPSDPATPTSMSALALAAAFLLEHGHGLATAVELLGGRSAFGRWCRLAGDLGRGRLTGRQAERELRCLLAVLRLEHLGGTDDEEGGLVHLPHPDSAVVHEICSLTDALAALVATMAEVTARQVATGRLPVVIVRAGPGSRGREVEVPRWRTSPAARVRRDELARADCQEQGQAQIERKPKTGTAAPAPGREAPARTGAEASTSGAAPSQARLPLRPEAA